MEFIYVAICLIALYLTKKQMTSDLTRLIHRLGGQRRVVIVVWSIIFLPGTIIHEISHFLAAAFTGARTGKIEILPEYLEDEGKDDSHHTVALGYVETQHLNPIQGFLVGIAPFISGLILLVFLASLMKENYLVKNYPPLFLQVYLFFTIANSFFPSWTDIKQTLTLVVLAITAVFGAWFLGVQFTIGSKSLIWDILGSLWPALLLSIAINSVIAFFFFLTRRLLRRF